MIAVYWLLVVANGVAFGTLAVGWWAVPVVSLVGALAAPRGAKPLLSVPLGALGGWAALLIRSARADGFDRLTQVVAELIPLPIAGLVAVTLAFPLVISLGAALIGGAWRRRSLTDQEVQS